MAEEAAAIQVDLEGLKRDIAHVFDQTLKAELAQMELRLVRSLNDSLAHKADANVVNELDKRIQSLEQSRVAREELPAELSGLGKRVTALERFRYAIPSAAVIALVISAMVLYFTWKTGTTHVHTP
jgi:hypothetical protein